MCPKWREVGSLGGMENAVCSQIQYNYMRDAPQGYLFLPTVAVESRVRDRVLFCLSLIHINHERCARGHKEGTDRRGRAGGVGGGDGGWRDGLAAGSPMK